MNLSTLIDVVIGMSMLFAVLALCGSALVELWAGLLDRRAKNLQTQLKNMLGEATLNELMKHPLMLGVKESDTNPSYIEPILFRQALLDLIRQELGRLPELPTVQDWVKALEDKIASSPDDATKNLLTSLRSLLQHQDGDMTAVNRAVDDWFNQCMQRATAWYKRNSQLGLFVALAVVVCTLNIDALQNVNALATNPALRAAIVGRATELVQDQNPPSNLPKPPEGGTPAPGADLSNEFKATQDLLVQAQVALSDYGFLVGWSQQRWGDCRGKAEATCSPTLSDGVLKVFGLLVSILAACLGADFWFSLITRLLPLRAVGKRPDEKS